MNRLINNICFMFLLLTSGAAVAEKPTAHIFGVGANYGYNFDGDMFENSQSIYFLYQYKRLQLELGIKHYKLLDNSEYIPDLGLLYSIHDGEKLDLKVGFGVEDKYPTIEYLAEYAINSNIGMNVALNQVLNDDFGQNQREVVVGFSYFFFDSSERNSSGDIETRPYSLNTNSSRACQIQPDTNECRVDTDVDKKTKLKEKVEDKVSLPYVVKEGDWLYQLRRDYGFDLEDIIQNNDIENPDLIIPGQVLE
ncbi:LysM peptidoglycan-binding domain-containing protein [Vibrio lentus]|uniref:LysM peptidoglycan-binding domain-containing protein n=1 Tax=Vibrio lentus TaxID=136468 RepID=UPI00178CF1EA|nr:LysM domain-containing protein [Vibrio lentus]MDN3628740.1 LysM domain-containing protein [Vibrio lentus]